MFLASSSKAINDFLTAHPAIKNLLNGLANALLGAAVAYLGPILDPGHAQGFTLAGLGFALAKGYAAWAQNNHDKILAILQDNVLALPQEVPLTNSSALTPEDVPTTGSKLTPPAPVETLTSGASDMAISANRATAGPLKAVYKPILRVDPPKQ